LQFVIQPDSSGLQAALAEAAPKPDELGWKTLFALYPAMNRWARGIETVANLVWLDLGRKYIG
jgi:hypothetical protein